MIKWTATIAVIVAVLLGYIAGTAIIRFEIGPYLQLREAFVAAEALVTKQTGREVPWHVGAKPLHPEDLAAPEVRDQESGVGRYVPELSLEGATIYTPVNSDYPIRLIDMQGDTLHEWVLPLEQIASERDDGLSFELESWALNIAYIRLFPEDGSLLAVLGSQMITPWGYAVIKIDRDSKLLWQYTRQAHHDVDIDPAGNIYVQLHTVIRKPWPGLEYIATPFIDDQIAILSPDGSEQEIISILDAIQSSDYESLLLYTNPLQPKGDLLHVNSVTWLSAENAAVLPNAAEGDLLISMRQIGVLAVLDPRARIIRWAVRGGQWQMQHDPDVLANGNLLVFDNRGDDANGGTTRIVEIDPQTLELVWEYPADSGERVYTSIYGSQQRLANGNTLISESNNGRIIEVTVDGDIAWEYKIPERKVNYRGVEVATVVFAERFTRDQLKFLTGKTEEVTP